MDDMEKRSFETTEVRVLKSDDDTVSFDGYVAKYGQRSRFLGFYEEIEPRAFDNALKEDKNIFALYNHEWDKVLGSTENGTLELRSDDIGLRFKLTPKANTSYINDVKELVESGELRGVSFGFKARKDKWRRENGKDVRTLLDVSLSEITLTPRPAYESSEVAVRSHENYVNEMQDYQAEQKAKINILLNL